MSLVYCGIDEAGYGPLLGPLCVGMVAFRVESWAPGDRPPDLWKLLRRAVCKSAKGTRSGAVAVADSKVLKGANGSATRHPLLHLERGVLSFARAAGHDCCDDAALFNLVGAAHEQAPWHAGDPIPLPVGSTGEEVAIAANVLKRALARAGVEVLDLRCRVLGVAEFNGELQRSGSKASTTEVALVEHLALARERWGGEALRIVCDRQSGRTDYSGLLGRAWPGEPLEELERTARVSRYGVGEGLGVQFVPEAESAHFPVALASMLAKLVRELAMARFNRYWTARMPDLKPTAGYNTDARRWLRDVNGALTPDEHRALVRIA